MRREFFRCLHEEMGKNENIYALTGDLGFGGFNKIMEDYPHRFINCGAAETSMLDIAVGLAMSGKIPFVYSISPFLILRPFETIRIYINNEKIPVILVGSGREPEDYHTEGFSHSSVDLPAFLSLFPNIKKLYPTDKEYIPRIMAELVENPCPSVILLKQQ